MDHSVIAALGGRSDSKWLNESDMKGKNPTSYTALISNIINVYNLFPGSVLYFGTYQGSGTVNIAVSNHEILRYLYLSELAKWPGKELSVGDAIGTAGNKHNLGIEYCTQWRGDSKYPVRVLGRTYYKQNPKDILDGLYTPPKETDVEYGINRYNDKIELTDAQMAEWAVNYQNPLRNLETRLIASRQYPDSD